MRETRKDWRRLGRRTAKLQCRSDLCDEQKEGKRRGEKEGGRKAGKKGGGSRKKGNIFCAFLASLIFFNFFTSNFIKK